MTPMKSSPEGHAIAFYFESCKLLAYPDPASPLFKALKNAGMDPYNYPEPIVRFASLSGAPWTIGHGDTGNCKQGDRIDQVEADRRFEDRMAREFEPAVMDMVQQNPTQEEFDALVDQAYNTGVAALRGSTLMRKYNLGDRKGAADEFLKWINSGGVPLLGLKRRRTAARARFLGASGAEAIRLGAAVSSL